ncbi:MAG: hypothetical protein R2822_16630 [Spirosomataceae bacterium]
MVCLDAMVARLKGEHDLKLMSEMVFTHLDNLQNHFNPSGQH